MTARTPHPAFYLLHAAGIPVTRVAEIAGCSQPSASRRVRNLQAAPPAFRGVVAGLLGRPMSELFHDAEPTP